MGKRNPLAQRDCVQWNQHLNALLNLADMYVMWFHTKNVWNLRPGNLLHYKCLGLFDIWSTICSITQV